MLNPAHLNGLQISRVHKSEDPHLLMIFVIFMIQSGLKEQSYDKNMLVKILSDKSEACQKMHFGGMCFCFRKYANWNKIFDAPSIWLLFIRGSLQNGSAFIICNRFCPIRILQYHFWKVTDNVRTTYNTKCANSPIVLHAQQQLQLGHKCGRLGQPLVQFGRVRRRHRQAARQQRQRHVQRVHASLQPVFTLEAAQKKCRVLIAGAPDRCSRLPVPESWCWRRSSWHWSTARPAACGRDCLCLHASSFRGCHTGIVANGDCEIVARIGKLRWKNVKIRDRVQHKQPKLDSITLDDSQLATVCFVYVCKTSTIMERTTSIASETMEVLIGYLYDRTGPKFGLTL